MQPLGRRVVAGPAHLCIHAKPHRLGRDIGLAHMLERGVDMEIDALAALARREPRHSLEARNEPRATVGIARIIQRVDADDDTLRPPPIAMPERQRTATKYGTPDSRGEGVHT